MSVTREQREALSEPRTCEVSLNSRYCKAPAGYAPGDRNNESCRGTCVFCGQPCCSACSTRTRRGRRCNDCAEDQGGEP